MHSQTIQALRAEIEAVTTLQVAFNRIAHSVDPDALSTWDGPRAEDVDDAMGEDGSFSREVVTELRAKAGAALGERYKEVERVVLGRAALESLLRTTLATGTGGVVAHEGPPPADVLNALARSGALRVDWASAAATQVKEVLDVNGNGASVPLPRPTLPDAPKAKKVAPEPKKKAAASARKTAKKPAAKKKAVKAKTAPKKAAAKKKSAPKKKPAAKKKSKR